MYSIHENNRNHIRSFTLQPVIHFDHFIRGKITQRQALLGIQAQIKGLQRLVHFN